jgi:predicted RNA-binding protein with PIN domain
MKKAPKEFVVDGYNLMHKLFPSPSPASLEVLREETEKKLLLFQRKRKYAITIVYDGKGSPRECATIMPMHVVFTPAGKSADQWIIEYVKSLNTSVKKVTIITSDHEIRRFAAAFGATCMTSELFAMEMNNSGSSVSLLKGNDRAGIEQKFKTELLSEQEVDQWKALFNRKRSQKQL